VIDLIHIGDYKTGTSWWQRRALPAHPEICLLDDPVEHKEIVHLMHQLVDSRDLDFNPELLKARFEHELERLGCADKKKIICRESLSGIYPTGDHAARISERLHAVFGDVKVLIIIREQFSMIESVYSQYIKIGGTLKLEEFVYDPIVSPGLIERLKYHKIIETYVDRFGRENVFVGLYEDFQKDNHLFASRVFEFIGCTMDWSLPSAEDVVNTSLTRVGLGVQRILNHFLRNDFNPRMPLFSIEKLVALFLSRKKKQRLMDRVKNRSVYCTSGQGDKYALRYAIGFSITVYVSRLCERLQIGPKLKVPNQLIHDLRVEFIESNRELRDEYGLPVDKFNWSL